MYPIFPGKTTPLSGTGEGVFPMLHLYCGNGKGKTTAAMGLALRAAGRGKRVVIAQFLKGADSGERFALAQLPQVTRLAPVNFLTPVGNFGCGVTRQRVGQPVLAEAG